MKCTPIASGFLCGSRPRLQFPATSEQLVEAGYKFADLKPSPCRGNCGAMMIWLITKAGNLQPFSAEPDGRLMPHHAVCPARLQFQKANKKHEARARGPQPVQEEFPFK